uniref:Uncharacterized protein n=1 Tax=Arundo donax TaxID=35708 RepID=A0A0A8ZWR9_ARUDO
MIILFYFIFLDWKIK